MRNPEEEKGDQGQNQAPCRNRRLEKGESNGGDHEKAKRDQQRPVESAHVLECRSAPGAKRTHGERKRQPYLDINGVTGVVS